jgi:putative hydrolase of the HAD superfamily
MRIKSSTYLPNKTKSVLSEIDLSLFRGLMIDIDDTLYNYDISHTAALNGCYKSLDPSIKKKLNFKNFVYEYTSARESITKKLSPQGSCRSRLFAFNLLFEKLQINTPYLLALKFDSIYWKEFIYAISPNKEILNFVKKCKKNNLTICAVSDMQAHIQILKLKKLSLTDYIDHLVTSEEAGVEKPNKKIFDLALQRMRLNKDQVMMIGDNIAKDIKGAESYGIKAIYFKA